MRTAILVFAVLQALSSAARAQTDNTTTPPAATAPSAAAGPSEETNAAVEELFASETDKLKVEAASQQQVAACAQHPDTELCQAVAKVCTSATQEDLPANCQSWAPVTDNKRSHELKDLGGGQTGTVAVPSELLKGLRKCLQDDQCLTLADMRQNYNSGYLELRLWCAQEFHGALWWQPAVSNICKAMDNFEKADEAADDTTLWELQRALGLHQAAKASQERAQAVRKRFKQHLAEIEAAAVTLKAKQEQLHTDNVALDQARDAHKAAKEGSDKQKAQLNVEAAEKAMEASKAQFSDFKKRNSVLLKAGEIVRAAKKAEEKADKDIKQAADEAERARNHLNETPSNALVILMKVNRFDLRLLDQTLSRPPPRCNGFGLIASLVSARYLQGGRYSMKGPVDAGIGGGYYWDVTCTESSTFGVQTFLFSEGLDPSNRFHVGAGVGLSLSAYQYFHFGLGIGYDLFRHEQPVPDAAFATSGLFTPRPVAPGNLLTLFTFSIRGGSEKQASKEEEAPAEK